MKDRKQSAKKEKDASSRTEDEIPMGDLEGVAGGSGTPEIGTVYEYNCWVCGATFKHKPASCPNCGNTRLNK